MAEWDYSPLDGDVAYLESVRNYEGICVSLNWLRSGSGEAMTDIDTVTRVYYPPDSPEKLVFLLVNR